MATTYINSLKQAAKRTAIQSLKDRYDYGLNLAVFAKEKQKSDKKLENKLFRSVEIKRKKSHTCALMA